MTIVGGTYVEICLEPIWENIFGSGFRAACLILENDNTEPVIYYTCADTEVRAHLTYYEKLFPRFTVRSLDISKSPEFRYDHPLRVPVIQPRPDIYCKMEHVLKAKDENILIYGLIEAAITVDGNKVVYDPQSPANPKAFSTTGSKANELVVVVNYTEAKILSGKQSLSDIKEFFFTHEKCFGLIIKNGAQGALLFESINDPATRIPVYKTDAVWPIGSGDVFTAYFAASWFKNNDLKSSVALASKATAIYCSSKDLKIHTRLETFPFEEFLINQTPSKQVYLAGPFFTFGERWIVNEVWTMLKGMGLKVFSPFHDVGHGRAEDVVSKDLVGLDQSEVLFAITDGLDSGTLFEIGYAVSKKKKIIAFVQNENEESLKMLEGTGCILERDLSTAIYKTYWAIAT